MDSHVFGYEPTEENVTKIQESSSVPNSEELYNNAYFEFTRGNYESAINSFRQYLRLFIDSELTGNAQYWIGESYYAQKDWQNALIEFKRVEKIYPKGNKIQTSLYKIGDCYLKLGDNKRAEDYFKKVIESFPNSPEAQMAKEKLDKMKPMITATVEVKNNDIMITSTPNGVNIYLDDKNKGTTPMQLKGVSFGSHIIRLSCTGYQDYTEKFRIEQLISAPSPFLCGLAGASMNALLPGLGETVYKSRGCCGCITISTSGFYLTGICLLIDISSKNKDLLTWEDKQAHEKIVKIELYTTVGFYLLNIISGYISGARYARRKR